MREGVTGAARAERGATSPGEALRREDEDGSGGEGTEARGGRRRVRLLLGLVVAVGLLVRVASLSYGLPDVYHPDEPRIVDRAVRFHGGDLNPRFFNWPSLDMYLLSGVYGLAFGSSGPGGVVAAFARDPAPFYLVGRLVTALFGTATLVVLYAVGAEAYGPAVGLLGSLFLAVDLLHVRDSGFVTTDVPLTFFVTLTALLALRYRRAGRLRDALAGGLVTGLGASMKYPGGLMLAPLALAHWLRPAAAGLPRWRRALGPELAAAGLAAAVGFVAGTPYAVLTPRAFVAGVLDELGEVGSVQFGNERDLPGYAFHLLHSLPAAMGLVLLGCAAVGLALALRRHAPADLVLLAFPLPYFAIIGSWSSRFERYTLPLLPFLALFAGIAVAAAGTRLRATGWRWARSCRPGLGLALAACLLAAPAFGRVVEYHALLARPDTRELAARWIEREVPPGARIALEPFTPSLPVAPAVHGYRMSRLEPYDFDALVGRGVQYVVLSGFMYERQARACARFPEACRFYRDVARRGTLLLAIEPVPAPSLRWVGDIYSPLTQLGERTHPGPSIKIYRIARTARAEATR